ncbi:MAG: cytochrome c3 family protein [Sutterellaceae bacterium]|nr:cytochrome c3 family protein [Sutterellaceae bacterium]MDD7441190.1 cytochrome c3 family protein [Sutterellaceae bacterium]MDY2868834.1 cytochrome c3 family protein [Mesosutterella sp.]
MGHFRMELAAIAAGLAAAFLLGTASSAAFAADGAPAMKKAECLACHGPIEKLTALPPKYDAGDGKLVNPHKFVPHDSKDLAKFPECTTCHTPHTMPPPKGFHDKNANVETCFSCHHEMNFKKCSECHK